MSLPITKPTADVSIQVGDTTTSFWLPLKAEDHVQRSIWEGKSFYEFQMLSHSQAMLAPGDEVIDVGAYIGNHTLFYANVCGAQVFSFEPNQAAFDTMMVNIELNGLGDAVTTLCAGVGAKPGRARLVLPDSSGNAGMCRLETKDTGTIEIVRLDDQESIRNPKLIKIDVEGMELQVLQGAEKLITEHHPMLYIESPTAAHFAQISKLLFDLGYLAIAHFNATTTVCFVHSTDSVRIENAQINYLQYDLRQQLGRLAKRVASNNMKRRFDELAKDLAADLVRQEKLQLQVDSLAAMQRQLDRSIQNLRKDIRYNESKRQQDMHSAFGQKTVRKIRKASKDPGRFITDSSSFKALRRLVRDEGAKPAELKTDSQDSSD